MPICTGKSSACARKGRGLRRTRSNSNNTRGDARTLALKTPPEQAVLATAECQQTFVLPKPPVTSEGSLINADHAPEWLAVAPVVTGEEADYRMGGVHARRWIRKSHRRFGEGKDSLKKFPKSNQTLTESSQKFEHLEKSGPPVSVARRSFNGIDKDGQLESAERYERTMFWCDFTQRPWHQELRDALDLTEKPERIRA
jgi:hypothetical protein